MAVAGTITDDPTCWPPVTYRLSPGYIEAPGDGFAPRSQTADRKPPRRNLLMIRQQAPPATHHPANPRQPYRQTIRPEQHEHPPRSDYCKNDSYFFTRPAPPALLEPRTPDSTATDETARRNLSTSRALSITAGQQYGF